MTNFFTDYVTGRWREHFLEHRLRISKVSPQEECYSAVLSIRIRAYGLPYVGEKCPIDEHSTLWLLSSPSGVIGTIRVTHAARGRLDCEEHFPQFFRADFSAITGSASRFCLMPSIPARLRAAAILTEYAWADALDQGIRCDVIDVNCRAIPYYERLGYRLFRDHSFTHPLLNTHSRVMVAVAHPDFTGRLKHILGVPDASRVTANLLTTLNGQIE
jgi:hypothetical protein